MPVFTVPLALLGLAALPALGAIYLLRNRYRRQPVSSLMLWVDPRSAREGGSRVQRLRMPWLILLELAILAAMVLAAVGPKVLASGAAPMVVVLDDSFSMQALDASGRSARRRGLEAVRAAVAGGPARFILAGRAPRLIGHGDASQGEGRDGRWVEAWRCRSPGADLEAAVRLAGEVGDAGARVLVVTDRPPPEGLDRGRVRWRAVGQPAANRAIVNAARAEAADGERLLLEIANYADAPRRAALTLRRAGAAESLGEPRWIELDAGERRRLVLDLPAGLGAIEAALDDDDALAIDNRVTLLADRQRKLGVTLAIGDADLRRHVRRALEATGRVRFDRPTGLWISDDAERTPTDAAAWPMYLHAGVAAGRSDPQGGADDAVAAYLGPFIVDRRHPLGEGLGLAGAIWAARAPAGPSSGDDDDAADSDGSPEDADAGAGPPAALPGLPIVAAGDRPLLTVVEPSAGRRTIHMAFTPHASTLQRSVAWPVLWANLVDWRLANAPGLDHTNARLGDRVRLIVQRPDADPADDAGDGPAATARIIGPDGSTTERRVHHRAVVVAADAPGRWRVEYEDKSYRFAVNAFAPDESDARGARAGRWGRWLDERSVRDQYVSVAWVIGLAALAMLGCHQWRIHRQSGGRPA